VTEHVVLGADATRARARRLHRRGTQHLPYSPRFQYV
jgi:hypothetical protein